MDPFKAFIASWLSHRKALHDLIDVVKDEHLNYKPWDNAMSLSELVLHISGSTTMFANTVKDGKFTPPSASAPVASAAELKAHVEGETNRTKADMEAFTDEQLTRIVEFMGMQMPGMALLTMMKDHEIHHKGQLFTYVRLLGVEQVPFFINRS